jgi:hypothetical protein
MRKTLTALAVAAAVAAPLTVAGVAGASVFPGFYGCHIDYRWSSPQTRVVTINGQQVTQHRVVTITKETCVNRTATAWR